MTISFKNNGNLPDIIFNEKTLDVVESHKHLGLTLAKNLGWTSHTENLLKSVTPMSDVLKKLKYKIDRKSLETIYFTFLRPKLEYGCHVWDNCTKQTLSYLKDFKMKLVELFLGREREQVLSHCTGS